jgi:hypothetical protein
VSGSRKLAEVDLHADATTLSGGTS